MRHPTLSSHVLARTTGGSVPSSRHAELNRSRMFRAYWGAWSGKWCRKFSKTYAIAFATWMGERSCRVW